MAAPRIIPTGTLGSRGAPGRDGANVLPTDEAIADAIADSGSETRSALATVVGEIAPTIPDSTTSAKGKVELATDAETVTGTDAVRATTPAGVAAAIAAHPSDVSSVNDQTGAVTIPSVLGGYLGQVGGAVVKPAALPPAWGVELWNLTNFLAGYNTSTLTPSLTADGTNKTVRTLAALGNMANQDTSFRLSFTVTDIPTTPGGWAEISVQPVDSGGALLSGAQRQTLVTDKSGPGGTGGTGLAVPVEFDFKVGAYAVGGTYLDVRLDVFNNTSAGSLAISNVSLRQTASPQRPLWFGVMAGVPPVLATPLFDPVTNAWRMAATDLSNDDVLDRTFVHINGYNTDRPWQNDPADADFLVARLGPGAAIAPSENLAAGQVKRSMRVNNNDQILSVKKTDGSYELRGNVHGGETLRSGAANNKMEYDAKGNGVWATWDGTGQRLWPCRKFRLTFNTQMQRSDAGSPFANVDHLATFFADGMMRMDRTTTFLVAQRLGTHFEWMSSHDLATPKIGRIGNGLLVLDEVDAFPKVATPAAPSNTPSTSGGTLPSGTRYYAVTALSEGGETNAGPTVSATNTGSASSNALTWAAVTGATGYRVYRGASPATLSHIATVSAIASPAYTDTNAPATGVAPPPVNRARQLDANTTVFDAAISDKASWAVWYDPIINMCFGNIFDRESIGTRPEVASVKVRLERAAGVMKNYVNVVMAPDGSGAGIDTNADNVPTRLITAGTVWAATHWAFTYVPADPVNYHLEIAARATDLGELKTAYPTS